MKKIFDNIVNSLYNYLIKYNLNTMVLGLSGGVDTAVCAYICNKVKLLSNNKIKFIAVNLPSDKNNSEQNNIAYKLGLYLADEYIIHDITSEFKFITNCYENAGSLQSVIQQGNIKSRLRMMFLYDIALQKQGIVIDPLNKTERYLGFFTLHGNIGDIAPLSDLWKSDIYKLLDYIIDDEANNEIKNILVELSYNKNKIIVDNDNNDKVADLTYIDIDIILKRVINARFMIIDSHIETFIKQPYINDLTKKYGENNIRMIIRRYFNSHYKRKHLPIKINVML